MTAPPSGGVGHEKHHAFVHDSTAKSLRLRKVFSALDLCAIAHDHKKHRINGLEPSAVFFQGQVHDCQRRDSCKAPHF
ncbi:hypothetical protein QD336_06075 [Rhizobium sp. BR 250]